MKFFVTFSFMVASITGVKQCIFDCSKFNDLNILSIILNYGELIPTNINDLDRDGNLILFFVYSLHENNNIIHMNIIKDLLNL